MSKKCRAFSKSKLGVEPVDNRKAFYAGWEAALAEPVQEPLTEEQIWETYMDCSVDIACHVSDLHKFAQAIEAAHGIGEKK